MGEQDLMGDMILPRGVWASCGSYSTHTAMPSVTEPAKGADILLFWVKNPLLKVPLQTSSRKQE